MSATVAYNFTLAFTNLTGTGSNVSGGRLILSTGVEPELNPLAVQLFCGTMEGISSEIDPSVRHRRLCVALQVIRKGGAAAKSLGRDLGFGEDLNSLTASSEDENLVVQEMKRCFASTS